MKHSTHLLSHRKEKHCKEGQNENNKKKGKKKGKKELNKLKSLNILDAKVADASLR